MTMTVTLKKRIFYDVTIGSKTLLFERKDDWNGLVELGTTDGQVLVIAPQPSSHFSSMLSDLLGGGLETAPAIVISGSPSLLAELFPPDIKATK